MEGGWGWLAGVALLFLILGWVVSFGSGGELGSGSYGGPVQWDASVSLWHLWHLREAVAGTTPLLHSDMVFYPVGVQMLRQEWTPVPGLLALPFQVLGPLYAYNLNYLVAYLLTGLFTYLLALRLCRNRAGALLAALAFTFCEYHVLKAHFHGQPGQAHQQFIPLYLLFLFRFFESNKIRDAAACGLCVVLATFCSGYQLVFLLLLTPILLGHRLVVARLVPERSVRAEARRTGRFVLGAGATAALLVAPIILPNLEVVAGGLATLPDAGFSHHTELTSYLSSSLFGPPRPDRLFDDSHALFLGRTVLALSVLLAVAHRFRRGAGLWLGCAALFWFLSLGPAPTVAGKVAFELPFYGWLQAIPVVRGARFVARFSSMAVLCLALALAIGLARADDRWLTRLPAWARLPLLLLPALLVATELSAGRLAWLAEGKGHQPFRLSPAYTIMGKDPTRSTVLTYPLSWESRYAKVGNVDFPSRMLMAYQPYFNKRIVTGFGDAIPRATLEHGVHAPWLSELARIPRGDTPPAPTIQGQIEFRNQIKKLNVKYVLMYKTPIPPLPERSYRVDVALSHLYTTVDLERLYEDRDLLLLRVHLPARPGVLVEGVDG